MPKVRRPLEDVLPIAQDLESELYKVGFNKVEIVGSVRRQDPDVGDIDVIVNGDMNNVEKIAADVVELGENKATIDYDGHQVNLWQSPLETWGAALFAYTGPRGYVIGYRKRAKDQGLLLNEKGLFDKDGNLIAGKEEADIYQALGKEYKDPSERGK